MTSPNDIIGSPFKMDILEVAQYDFPEEMNWDDFHYHFLRF
jgi:hypothetical protein